MRLTLPGPREPKGSEPEPLKPLRKALHLMAGSAIVGLYVASEKVFCLSLLIPVFLLLLLVDLLRLHFARLNEGWLRIFSPLVMTKDRESLNASTLFLLGSILSIFFFSRANSLLSIGYLTYSDAVASIIGKTWGRHQLPFGKSLEGSLAFLFTSLAITLPFLDPVKTILISLATTLVEALPLRLDDNLLIPLFSGALLTLIELAM